MLASGLCPIQIKRTEEDGNWRKVYDQKCVFLSIEGVSGLDHENAPTQDQHTSPVGDRRTAVGEHVRTNASRSSSPGSSCRLLGRRLQPEGGPAGPALSTGRTDSSAKGGASRRGPAGRQAAPGPAGPLPTSGNTSELCAGHGHRYPAAVSSGWRGRMETALPGTARRVRPRSLSPDAEVAAGPTRSRRRATRPGTPRRPSARPLRPHPPPRDPGTGTAPAGRRRRRRGAGGTGGWAWGAGGAAGGRGWAEREAARPPPPLMPSRQQRTRWAAGESAGPLAVPRQCRRGGHRETMARKGEASAHLYGERGARQGERRCWGGGGRRLYCPPACLQRRSARPNSGGQRQTEFVPLGECGGAVAAGTPERSCVGGRPRDAGAPGSAWSKAGRSVQGKSRWAQRWGRADLELPPPPSPREQVRCGRFVRVLGQRGAGRQVHTAGRAGPSWAEPTRVWDAWSVVRGRGVPGALCGGGARCTCGLPVFAAGASRWSCRAAPREGHRGQNWVFGLCLNCSLEGRVFAMRGAGFAKLLSLFEGVATKLISSSNVRDISVAKQTCRMSKPP